MEPHLLEWKTPAKEPECDFAFAFEGLTLDGQPLRAIQSLRILGFVDDWAMVELVVPAKLDVKLKLALGQLKTVEEKPSETLARIIRTTLATCDSKAAPEMLARELLGLIEWDGSSRFPIAVHLDGWPCEACGGSGVAGLHKCEGTDLIAGRIEGSGASLPLRPEKNCCKCSACGGTGCKVEERERPPSPPAQGGPDAPEGLRASEDAASAKEEHPLSLKGPPLGADPCRFKTS